MCETCGCTNKEEKQDKPEECTPEQTPECRPESEGDSCADDAAVKEGQDACQAPSADDE